MKKRILIIAAIVCIVALIGFGTLAYFQDYKEVTNMFAVAGASDPNDPNGTMSTTDLFSIKLYETRYDETTDSVVADEITESGNVYDDLLPNTVITKDPTVENTGKYAAWIRMKVTLTNANNWMAAFQKHDLKLTDIFRGIDQNKWYGFATEYDATGSGVLVLTCYLREALPAEDDAATAEKEDAATLFTSVKIPEELEVADLAALASFHVKVRAEAIQAANNGASAVEAFQNWDSTMAPVQ